MPTVMVVDDAPLTRATLKRLLVREGYDTVTARDGTDALRQLQEHRLPDVILLDVNTPDVDGLELLEKIHSHPQWRALPIVMLTSVSDAHTIHRAQQLGAKALLVKAAFNVHEMMREIKSCTAYRPN
jgi:chemosensory pili system protein ChpA (sensor histidine kinase/response regulator)